MGKEARFFSRVQVHYAWAILILVYLATLTGAGIRSGVSVLINPLESEFGWNRIAISSAASLNLLLYGVGAPAAGWLIDRFGPRRVTLWSLAILTGGVAGSLYMTVYWQFFVLWGVVIGLTSAGVASVLAGPVANRWFASRRGLALGLLNSASATGQVLFLPLLMMIMATSGWRTGLGLILPVTIVVLVMILLWLRDNPSDMGLAPYGASDNEAAPSADSSTGEVVQPETKMRLSTVFRNSTFWILVGSFFICGGTSIGLVGTHMIPHTIDHGFPQGMVAATISIMGGMNFVGTVLAGWLTDRIEPRKILLWVFALRGLSLFVLPFVHDTGLFVFGIIYGLDWAATVPPVVTLTSNLFGKRSLGTVYGLVFMAHQVGASLAALAGGALRVWLGNYKLAFLLGGAAALIGAGLALGIPARRMLQARSASL